MNQNSIEQYFNAHGSDWITAGYQTDGYNFPTAIDRVQKTLEILNNHLPDTDSEIVDLGCGNGHLCREIAQLGYRVIGVDRSDFMIDTAIKSLSAMPFGQRALVTHIKSDVLKNGLENASADAVTAMGVIGYLTNDDLLFAEAARLLRSSGYFIVSCRNQLFNMVSISDHTSREIDEGTAKDLIEEIQALYSEIPTDDASRFIRELARTSDKLAATPLQVSEPAKAESSSGSDFNLDTIEARQHTPKRLRLTAKAHGFEHLGDYGIHPHLLMAGLCQALPPHVFNILSSSLKALDHLPASLIWSSAFIGVFRKTP